MTSDEIKAAAERLLFFHGALYSVPVRDKPSEYYSTDADITTVANAVIDLQAGNASLIEENRKLLFRLQERNGELSRLQRAYDDLVDQVNAPVSPIGASPEQQHVLATDSASVLVKTGISKWSVRVSDGEYPAAKTEAGAWVMAAKQMGFKKETVKS